jgi:two-component sensor histidine kinase
MAGNGMNFLVSDPDHAPFGYAWLRGITPMRLAVMATVCLIAALSVSIFNFARDDFSTVCLNILRRALDTFAAGMTMFILVIKADIATARSRPRARIAAIATAVGVGAMAYAAIRWSMGSRSLYHYPHAGDWYGVISNTFRSAAIGGLLAAILHFETRQREMERNLYLARRAQVEVERQVSEARLKVLQSQIEPHFLFNSLASVKLLYEREPTEGRLLLRNITEYLRTASRGARRREASLAEEIALARSFLAIFQVRMGHRLQVSVDVPADLDSAQVPPLMIGTLIENAIKHGIGPRASGGVLALTATGDEDVLEIRIRDDGVGFRSQSGHGVGLANVRARLETMFGAAGTLDLAANPAGGVTATLRMPLRHAMESTA